MKYGWGHLFFGHKLRVTRRHQGRGRRQGGSGAIHVRSSLQPSTVSFVNKTCARCGGWYLEGDYSSHVKTPGHVSALSRPAGRRVGTEAAAGFDSLAAQAAENQRGVEWIQATQLDRLPGELMGLVGASKIDMAYSGERREVTFTPPLDELARLGLDAKARATRLLAQPAPNMRFDSLKIAAIDCLEAIADYHAWQVGALRRFTPENCEDGSYKELYEEFGALFQPKLDALTPYAAQLNGVLMAIGAGLDDLLARIEASTTLRR
jgi:hypothetical protein